MLKMKNKCERCSAATPLTGEAYICSYECTYCQNCAVDMKLICPNCGGNLEVRPKRTRSPAAATTTEKE